MAGQPCGRGGGDGWAAGRCKDPAAPIGRRAERRRERSFGKAGDRARREEGHNGAEKRVALAGKEQRQDGATRVFGGGPAAKGVPRPGPCAGDCASSPRKPGPRRRPARPAWPPCAPPARRDPRPAVGAKSSEEDAAGSGLEASSRGACQDVEPMSRARRGERASGEATVRGRASGEARASGGWGRIPAGKSNLDCGARGERVRQVVALEGLRRGAGAELAWGQTPGRAGRAGRAGGDAQGGPGKEPPRRKSGGGGSARE
jgi:hypothetical protein